MTRLIDSLISDKPRRSRDAIATGWRSRLLLTRSYKRHPLPIFADACTASNYAPEWKGMLGHNLFSGLTMALVPPPGLQNDLTVTYPRLWTNLDDTGAMKWLHQNNINVGIENTFWAVRLAAANRPYHSVKDWLRSLVWDQSPFPSPVARFNFDLARRSFSPRRSNT